jgi:hypothetical protein
MVETVIATEILFCPSCGKLINVEARIDLPSRTLVRIGKELRECEPEKEPEVAK